MKKILLFLGFLPAIGVTHAQDNGELKAVLQKIIGDSASLFGTYKGVLTKPPAYDSLYEQVVSVHRSSITIPGTYNNEISATTQAASYLSIIGEQLSVKEANALMKEWKRDLKSALGRGYHFTEENIDHLTHVPTRIYKFQNGKSTIILFRNNVRQVYFLHLHIHHAITK